MRVLVLIFSVFFLVSGCSYKVLRPESLYSYRITKIVNHTAEPGLEDRFIRVFKEEASLVGLKETREPDVRIEIGMSDFKLKSLSVVNSLVAEYAVTATVYFSYTLKGGKKVSRAYSTEFIESFLSSQDINLIEANKERLTEKALREIARRAIEEMILFVKAENGVAKT